MFLLTIRVVAQDLPVGFLNFLIPSTYKNSGDQSICYRLYTDNTCSEKSYYGYLNYELYNGPTYIYPHLILHTKDSSSKLENVIPSIGCIETYADTPRLGMIDTIYKADEESFFTVIKSESNKLCFSLNDNINLWVKTSESIEFYNPSDFLTNEYPLNEEQLGLIILPESTEQRKISLSDSLSFNNIATDFLKAFENKDTEKIKKNSLKLIHCQLSSLKDFNLIIPLDSFISESYKGFDNFLFGSIKKRGFRISTMLMPNFHPKYLPNNYEKDLVVFEARIMTYEPNELNDGHDGLNYCFYFVKTNDNFKFFLFNCIPK